MQRSLGRASIVGAAMAIAGNAVLVLIDPAVSDDRVSYPLSTGAFAAGQVWFALTQALMALGIVGLVRSRAVDDRRSARVLGGLAVVGMWLTVPGELVLVAVASRDVDSGAAAAASGVFGLGVLLADVGLIGFGVLALRQHGWALPWRAVPLLLGLFQLLVVTPVSLSLGFASVASFAVIAVADLLTALIGVALLREPETAEFSALPQSVGA
jgi:hypothetical protein